MQTYDQAVRRLGLGLAAIAGFVDAIGFMAFGGFFVSFMSGNSTRLGVSVAAWAPAAAFAGLLLGAFVSGVALGTLLARRLTRPRLGLLWAIAACLALVASPGPANGWLRASILALAMGGLNIILDVGRDARVGVTYMTGALVKLGQSLADVVERRRDDRWRDHLLLWASLTSGAVGGAMAYRVAGLASLWAPCAVAILLGLVFRSRTD